MSRYNNIFSDATMQNLSQKSAQSLKDMLGNKHWQQAMMDTMRLVQQVMQAEAPHREALTNLAVYILKETYPIINQAEIDVQAEIVDFGNLNMNQNPGESDGIEPDDEKKLAMDKRRIINAITQGSSFRGTFAFYMFLDALNAIDDSLVDKYREIINLAYGIYDSDEAVAMMLAMMSQQGASQGGECEAVWDEDEEVLRIKAKAVTFPILMQELVKGLYEILSLQGFSSDAEQNQKIVDKVDKVTNEPEDFRYGKFIYDALNNHYINAGVDDSRIRELFFVEVYKLSEKDFLNFIEDSINGTNSSAQLRWVDKTISDIQQQLKQQDSDETIGNY